MNTVKILKGLPASGKTTQAKKEVAKSDGWVKRVNKDDIRGMMDGGRWNRDNEKVVLQVRDQIILTALKSERDVIVDDTNLSPKHEAHIRNLVSSRFKKEGQVQVVVDDSFLSVPVEECILRDSKREKPVGEKAIRRMYHQFLFNPEDRHPLYREQSLVLPRAIIVDIDGTLSLMKDRTPYEWAKVGNDIVNEPVRYLIDSYCNQIVDGVYHHINVILVTGRDAVCRPETERWLEDNNISYDYLYMRPEGDKRPDYEVKQEIFNNHIDGEFYVEAAFDDRNSAVKAWRDLGLLCLQVAPGNF